MFLFPWQDYMDDSHGKEISLQYVTVKVPGQKPRGSRSTQPPAAAAAAAMASGAAAPGAPGAGPQFALGAMATTLPNGLNDPLNPASMAGFPANKDKRAGKVMLTGYEVLREPVDRGSEDGIGVSLAAHSAVNGDGHGKSETPSVKKRHRRMKSSSNKANDLEGS